MILVSRQQGKAQTMIENLKIQLHSADAVLILTSYPDLMLAFVRPFFPDNIIEIVRSGVRINKRTFR